eukprot:gene19455-6674_t
MNIPLEFEEKIEEMDSTTTNPPLRASRLNSMPSSTSNPRSFEP